MNVRIAKEWGQLTPASQRRVNDYWARQYGELLERNMRIMLDLYLKMACVTMYDDCGMSEEEIYLFLAHHRKQFNEQIKLVRAEEQIEYLNRRMKEIFKERGFPQEFFDKMLGSVESSKNEQTA